MNHFTYNHFQNAKKNHDIKTIEKLYCENKVDIYIKFEYAKLLKSFGRKHEAKVLFEDLAVNSNHRFTKLELAKLEFEFEVFKRLEFFLKN